MRQPNIMVKYTQTVRRLSLAFADKLSVFDRFVGLALKGLTKPGANKLE